MIAILLMCKIHRNLAWHMTISGMPSELELTPVGKPQRLVYERVQLTIYKF
jgi:hypothetical protein